MARRISRSQLANQLRQAQARQRQAINNYNAQARKVNRAIDNYNREARAYNAAVRTNRDRLRRELTRLNRTTTTTRYTVYARSVTTVQQSFARLETAAEADTWSGDDELFDLSEGEAANSVEVLNALLDEAATTAPSDSDLNALRTTTIMDELDRLDPDLDRRWRGALFSLHPQNPDASRHFCTSAREMLGRMIERVAPTADVLAANPNAEKTTQGSLTRRARIRHCLDRRESSEETLVAFIEADLENVLTLFQEFNDGTHGNAGRFNLRQLQAIKRRVEDAVRFVARIAG